MIPVMIPSPLPMADLPLVAGEPVERADAARNRRRVLAAAERLFTRDGVSCTTMDAIAAEAGVGKGTLFRRFGDRASLVRAVIGDREQVLQEELIRGAPPLGPGAPPCERLIAFGSGMLDLLDEHADLLVAAESGRPGAHLRSLAASVYHVHVAMLVRGAQPELDPILTADALLGSLSAQLFLHQRHERAVSLEALKTHWAAMVVRLLGQSSSST
jgi:AcrR family transcriptional regulator